MYVKGHCFCKGEDGQVKVGFWSWGDQWADDEAETNPMVVDVEGEVLSEGMEVDVSELGHQTGSVRKKGVPGSGQGDYQC